MITFKNKYDGSLVMSQQTHAQEVTSHFPVARLVTIGHFQSEQSLVVVAQWEEHALSVSSMIRPMVRHILDKNLCIRGSSTTMLFLCVSLAFLFYFFPFFLRLLSSPGYMYIKTFNVVLQYLGILAGASQCVDLKKNVISSVFVAKNCLRSLQAFVGYREIAMSHVTIISSLLLRRYYGSIHRFFSYLSQTMFPPDMVSNNKQCPTVQVYSEHLDIIDLFHPV